MEPPYQTILETTPLEASSLRDVVYLTHTQPESLHKRMAEHLGGKEHEPREESKEGATIPK